MCDGWVNFSRQILPIVITEYVLKDIPLVSTLPLVRGWHELGALAFDAVIMNVILSLNSLQKLEGFVPIVLADVK